MKVGSSVELINEFEDDKAKRFADSGIVIPIKGIIYTVRAIDGYPDGDCIRLEEIVNRKFIFKNGLREPTFDAEAFHELLPPMQIDLEEILEKELV